MSYSNAFPTQEGLCGLYFAAKSRIGELGELQFFCPLVICMWVPLDHFHHSSLFQTQRVLSSATRIPIKYKLQREKYPDLAEL